MREWSAALRLLASVVVPRGRAIRRARSGHLVVVANAYPPSRGGGVYRVVALVRSLASAGYRITVVTQTPANPISDEEAVHGLPSSVRVCRVPRSVREPSHRFIPRIEGERPADVRAVGNALRQLDTEEPIDAIVASGPRFGPLVAAASVASGRSLTLVLDMRDEWTTNSLDFVRSSRGDGLWERTTLRQAHRVVATTPATVRRLAERHRLPPERFACIRNGSDWTLGSEGSANHSPSPSAGLLGFYGNGGSWWDFPELLETLDHAIALTPELGARLRWEVVGEKAAAIRRAFARFPHADVLHCVGHMERRQVWRRMRNCQGLLLPNGPQLHHCIPGKVYEYLTARRPILLYGSGGEVGAFLRGYPGLVAVSCGDGPGLAAGIQSILDGSAQRRMDESSERVEAFVTEQQRAKRGAEYCALLAKLLDDRGGS